ncbi:hypothetical protein LXL04_000762 [Taraxacum kok-saghyz]
MQGMKKTLDDLPSTMEKLLQSQLRRFLPPQSPQPGTPTTPLSGTGTSTPPTPPPPPPPPPPFPPPPPPPPPVDETLFSLPKVKLPLFDGSDTRGWVTKADLYFKVHNTPPSQMLYLSQMCMDGSALHWFTNLLIRHPHTTWEQFRLKLLNRFSGTRFRNAHEALGSLYQEDGVEEYITAFEELTALIPNQSEEQSIGWYLRGLKPEIKNWVRTLYPLTCDQPMEFSRNVETAMGLFKGKSASKPRANPPTIALPNFTPHNRPYSSPGSFYPGPPKPTSTPGPNFTRYPDKPQIPTRPTGTRNLSKTEWEDRRRKGLCFNCGLKYSPQHKCTEGSMRILLLTDSDETDDSGDLVQPDDSLPDEPIPDGECSSLESCGFSSNPNPPLSTIKLSGDISGLPALILLDSGASHNFISRKLAIALGLSIHHIPKIRIKLGDNRKVWLSEQCRNINIQLGSFSCTIDALVIELGDLDVILGIAWLRTLGDVLCNWLTQRIQFWNGSSLVTLQGIPHGDRGLSPLHTFLEDQPECPNPNTILTPSLTANQQQLLDSLLSTFNSLFQNPRGLPPT